MKHTFYKYFAAGALLLALASCQKNNLVVDQEPLTPPERARFLKTTSSADFYVLENPAPGAVYSLPVGVTTVSNVDRIVRFTYSGTAVAGTDYTAPAELVIPAGKAVDTLRIQGLFATFPEGKRTLKVKIANGDGAIINQAYKDSFVLSMQKYCEVILNDLQGEFTNTRETNSAGGSPYPADGSGYTSYVELTPGATATTANVTFGQFWDYPIEVTGTIDWANPAAFAVTIPLQETGIEYDTNQPISVRTSPGQPSTFSSCDQTYALTVDFIISNYPTAGQTAYYSQNYKIYIER